MFIPCHAACACVKPLLLAAASRNRSLRGVLETRQALRTVSCSLGAVRQIFLLLILTHSTCEENCEKGEVLRPPCPLAGRTRPLPAIERGPATAHSAMRYVYVSLKGVVGAGASERARSPPLPQAVAPPQRPPHHQGECPQRYCWRLARWSRRDWRTRLRQYTNRQT